jgi:hypothetical protein
MTGAPHLPRIVPPPELIVTKRLKEPCVAASHSIKPRFLLLLSALAIPLLGADQSAMPGLAPAQDWKLPLFTKDGFRSMSLRGDRVLPVSSDRIDVENIEITVFSGDAAARVTSVLLSSQASYFPKENIATGPGAVRVIRDNIEISGEDWTYEKEGEKISIHRNARVVFNMKLGDMLR